MNKQTQNSAWLSIGLLMIGVIATMGLFFSSCKKKKEPPPVPVATETFYTVTFNSNGGTAVNPVQVKKRNTITLPASPTKTDFVFGGWFTDDKTFKDQFDPKTLIIINFTLYAKWDVPEYTVTFDSKGGSEVKPIQVKKGNTITLPASPAKIDFVFGGWYTDKEASVSPFSATTTINANLTLYAKWDVPEYTVTFNSNGGTAVNPVQVKKGSTVTLPASPTKTDFVFGGWFTDDKTFKNQFDAKTPIVAALTLYAKWNTVAPAVFTLSSTSFTNGGEIPIKYSYLDMNISPQLSWANAPEGTKSFLLIVNDISTGNQLEIDRWVVSNIPISITSLAESENGNIAESIPNIVKKNYIQGYIGPYPPRGEKHTYQFIIYALKLNDNYFSDTNMPPRNKQKAEEQLKDYILGSALITGTFERK